MTKKLIRLTLTDFSETEKNMLADLVRIIVQNIMKETYSSVTVKDKKVKMTFAEPFATLEKLIRIAKQGIAEYGYDEFAKALETTKEGCLKSIKKEPEGSFDTISQSSICSKWWTLTYGLTLQIRQIAA